MFLAIVNFGAIVGGKSGNFGFIIIGMVVVIVILIAATLFAPKK